MKMKPIKVLFLDLVYDYNSKDHGLGYGYYNFHLSFEKMHDINYIHFDVCDFGDLRKREANNADIIEIVKSENPDIVFYISYDDLVHKETLRLIKECANSTTIHWFCDDQWRFDSFSKDYCWNFDYCVTTHHSAVEKYREIGYKNIILSQWAANPDIYKKLNLPYQYDVSFVGRPHGIRRPVVDRLRSRGVEVATFGYGWKLNFFTKQWNRLLDKVGIEQMKFETGAISHSEMIKVINQTKVNLNLSANSCMVGSQMKGRHFEIPACGGFLLTEHDPDLENYYEPGKEVECFHSFDEMHDKIRFYLSHENERKKIARAGYERTLREHTWDKRFEKIFSAIKLKK